MQKWEYLAYHSQMFEPSGKVDYSLLIQRYPDAKIGISTDKFKRYDRLEFGGKTEEWVQLAVAIVDFLGELGWEAYAATGSNSAATYFFKRPRP